MRITCYSTDNKYCPPLLGIGTDYTEEQVIQRLGKPAKSELSETSRAFKYPDLNFAVYFKSRKAYMFQVTKAL